MKKAYLVLYENNSIGIKGLENEFLFQGKTLNIDINYLIKDTNMQCNIYKLDSIDKNKIKQVIEEEKENVVVLTKNKNFFCYLNRYIHVIKINNIERNKDNSIKQLDTTLHDSNYLIYSNIEDIIKALIEKKFHLVLTDINTYFFKYTEVFNLNFELLIKGTTYETISINKEGNFDVKKLLYLIKEDINLIKFKSILTSRLSIILYRLFFFDLNAKKIEIGKYFCEKLNVKSRSYSFKSLNNNCEGFYFTDLINKPFKGYLISVKTFDLTERNDIFSPLTPNFYNEKITIAKKLLRAKVKISTISNALDIDENILEEQIYGE